MADDAMIRKQNLALLGKKPGELSTLLGKSYSYWRDLMVDPKKSFGEKTARDIEERYPLPRGWLDVPHDDREPVPQPGQANSAMAQPVMLDEITVPSTISWEALGAMQKLPARFTVLMPDDSLAGHIDKGTGLIFERDLAPAPGKTVLLEDAEGQRFIRLYALVRGGHWQAHAKASGYVTLDSKEHTLKVLATMKWREG